MMEPILEELANEYKGRLRVCKINVDQNPAIASLYDVTGLPTFILYREREELQRKVGAQSKAQLQRMLREIL
jgi:thioredoxin 1